MKYFILLIVFFYGVSMASAQAVTSNPFEGTKIAEDKHSALANWLQNQPDSKEKKLLQKVALQPTAFWMGGWNVNIKQDVDRIIEQSQGTVPVFVAYNIPGRDCRGYSAGGSNNPESYKKWIREFASGIQKRKAVVILEPDALSMNESPCLSAADQAIRANLLNDTVQIFSSLGSTAVYLDAGHPNWKSSVEIADRLMAAGVKNARGFSLNVSNFISTPDCMNYAKEISQILASKGLGNKYAVIDTSRNGNGALTSGVDPWCNPPGRALGEKPAATNQLFVDAFLWVKAPGVSDGPCNGGPAAGELWIDYALKLALSAKW